MADINKINESLPYNNSGNGVVYSNPLNPGVSFDLDTDQGTFSTPRSNEDISSGGGDIDTSDFQLISEKNQPSGYAGLDSDGEIVGTIILRNDTAANLAAVVLSEGEPGYATDTGKFAVGDGATTFANLGSPVDVWNEISYTGNNGLMMVSGKTRIWVGSGATGDGIVPTNVGDELELIFKGGTTATLNLGDEPFFPEWGVDDDNYIQGANLVTSKTGAQAAYLHAVAIDYGGSTIWMLTTTRGWEAAI